MPYIISHINMSARLIVGLVFVFSGLTKLNDPVGFSYKIREYLRVLALPWSPWLRILLPYALGLALMVTTLECVLGLSLLIGFQIPWTLYALLLLTLFFTCLTLYTATSRRLTSCGCFGDAVALTPWQSFVKSIALLVLLGWLCGQKQSITPLLSGQLGYYGVGAMCLGALALGYYTIHYLPLIDLSPYKVGGDLAVLLPATSIMMESKERTTELFKGTQLLIVVQEVKKLKARELRKLQILIGQLQDTVQPLLITASRDTSQVLAYLEVPIGEASATLLQDMLRINTGCLLLERGVIIGKWSLHALHHMHAKLDRLQLLRKKESEKADTP